MQFAAAVALDGLSKVLSGNYSRDDCFGEAEADREACTIFLFPRHPVLEDGRSGGLLRILTRRGGRQVISSEGVPERLAGGRSSSRKASWLRP